MNKINDKAVERLFVIAMVFGFIDSGTCLSKSIERIPFATDADATSVLCAKVLLHRFVKNFEAFFFVAG